MNAPVKHKTKTNETAVRPSGADLRHDWGREEILNLMGKPFLDLVFEAQTVHRRHHAANKVQKSELLSVKTGGCAEDCAYCPQSAKYKKETGLDATRLMQPEDVIERAKAAKADGATRYCMGAAWTSPKDRDMEKLTAMIRGVKALGMETCATLGMLSGEQAGQLAEAGLDYYNHNLDTSPEYYGEIITTRTYDDRLDTLAKVRKAGMNVCCGGILGMGEAREDRAGLLEALATMDPHPESVPINMLVPVEGTPLGEAEEFDPLEFVRTIAVARIIMPESYVRLSAGRETMSEELQALCFMAGANSVFAGDRLLTTPNPGMDRDAQLFARLGIEAEGA